MKLLKALCWILLALTLLAVLVMVLRPSLATQAGAAQTGLLLLFVILHAWLGYTARGMAAFVVIAGVVAFTLEAISIATGFPFGSYTHHLPGLKPLGVPLVALAGWIMFSWLAWALARLIMRPVAAVAVGGAERLTTPIVATFILGGYDLVNDPIGATAHNWYSYDNPTGALGVPLTNYLGWLLTGWVIFQLVALIEPRFPGRPVTQSRAYWLLPCLFWLSTTAQVFDSLIHPTDGVVVRGGKTIVIADVYESCASAALFTVVFTGITALIRVYSRPSQPVPR
ncbi:carotenoid biosynthesis protein [Mycobacterium sp. Dal123C01]|uniref:carotenoid biosynthesis protein n=1 Tax=Mycobacterium sp. Dal123C01 TaxID=3457577 RepID=UPI00403ED071